ncbi:uncharacterized protein PITG_06997 [Phytophthora infestans T30-4]|uniref:Uncharacterized protein n=2 Tax=Phytophthora infestans TaxID=4787 RepID=D0N702_PHYIT|nr:uncharacterized protein PITG_06997 [Phytophthora infestans T30-4]EEY53351.1 conserved hypothetical protein [Phytophthora infestans T30-4]KAF4144960.1 hypothetical protein GN958_ATG05889 [Phytophthora infestans]|eukprot:XP_002904969.1 conserved hypothetical protein [Phytophthora infestans T30-4]
MLEELGFWCPRDDERCSAESSDANRPNPLRLVDDAWFVECDPALLKTIEWYLTRAFVESHELAYSFCRFSDCLLALEQPRVMGACTMTDGVYCWPEGYWHYVSHHHVKPPQTFLDHLLERYGTMAEMTRKARKEKKLLLWDGIEQKAVAMPRSMQDWITSHTTIQTEP